MSVSRSGEVSTAGYYCRTRHVWMIQLANGSMPIILAARKAAELLTKTKVCQEQDDQIDDHLPRTVAKTDIRQGEDDIERCAREQLELATKTEAKPERDDFAPEFLDLVTKTDAIRERDDR
jgi:hypothetical protein